MPVGPIPSWWDPEKRRKYIVNNDPVIQWLRIETKIERRVQEEMLKIERQKPKPVFSLRQRTVRWLSSPEGQAFCMIGCFCLLILIVGTSLVDAINNYSLSRSSNKL